MWHVWETGEAPTDLWWGNLIERPDLEDLGMAERIIPKQIVKKYDGSKDWIGLAQDDMLWAFVNTEMKLRVS
jgi:hypothetical protein